MRPSISACRKYIRDASGWLKDVTDGNDNGTDGQTDRVRRNAAASYGGGPHNNAICGAHMAELWS